MLNQPWSFRACVFLQKLEVKEGRPVVSDGPVAAEIVVAGLGAGWSGGPSQDLPFDDACEDRRDPWVDLRSAL